MITQYLRISVLLVAVLFISACAQESSQVVHLHGNTMGTTYNVKYVVDERGQLEGLQEEIDARLVEINKLMSTYDPTSELSRFNQNRFTTPFEVSEETATVIAEAIRLGHLSHNVLDVTVGPLVNLWGFGPNKRPEKIPTEQQVTEVRDYVGLDKLTLNGSQLAKSHPMTYVDLSTIAKGYGVDKIADIMQAHDLHNFLVEIGGEMRVKGERGNGEEWLIAIEKPESRERSVQKIVSIGEHAIATSGDYRNYYEMDGKRYSHLIDPRTGSPITHNLVSVTVVDKSSMTADGLATAFNVMGWDEAKSLAEKENLAVFLIRRTQDGFEEYASPHFDEVVDVKN